MQATLSHYRVLEEIGKGGMGVVYRAHDERLDRDVALKVLPFGVLTDEAARRRFRKEAFALSKLNHPNIATVHDFDSENGTDFLVEELIEGLSLDQMIISGPLPEREIVTLGSQLCEGLAAAHERRIIHRDLKPANIRITPDARLKVLDFGLAKVMRSPALGSGDDATASFTETQAVSGTVPYMAPEQLLNEELDARTDLWATGCVLYEMATARRPFCGSGTALTDAILHKPPDLPSSLNPKVAPGLEAIILKCLEKDPALRYASARDIAVDLRRLGTGTATKALSARRRKTTMKVTGGLLSMLVILGAVAWFVQQRRTLAGNAIRSIAVLPFVNLSGDPNQEYFADGMTESLITNLGKLTGLKKVMARTAVMRFKGSKQSPADIARELKVDGLITGGVLRSGNNVRVTAQLINPASGEQLWTQTYQHDVGDILRLQNEMTTAIAAEIRIKISANEQASLASSRPVNPEAYDAYLLGRYYMYKMSAPALQQAIEYYQIALEKDPNYGPALLGIASVWGLREHLGYVAPGQGSARAKSSVLKVLEADNTSAEAHHLLANQQAWHDWEWDAGLREFQRAIELNPNHSDARFFYSLTLYALRRSDEARQQMDIALTLDPYNPQFHVYSAVELRAEGHLAEALLELDRAAELGGGSPQELARTYERMGRYKEAIDAWKNFYAAQPEAVRALEEGYASGNYKNAMRRVADALAKQHIKGADRQSMTIASHYVAAGEDALALDWLEAACDKRIGPLPYINAHNDPFESLRSHPRFQELLRRMNLLR